MTKQGIFIISLDFELNWGVHDVFTLEQYEENIMGARKAIPRMLELFEQFNIHATWATVGLLSFKNKKELVDNLPSTRPNYANQNFSPYGKLDIIGGNEEEDPLHYASSLISQIVEYPNQELASHTFSHYYCLEKGQTIKEFEADLKASIEMGVKNGRSIQSLVFPRNQSNMDYLQICKAHGITSFRGNEKSRVYEASAFHSESLVKRIFRLLDSYVDVFGHHTYPLRKVDLEPIVNLPSSRFLRPYSSRLKFLEPLRLRRIEKSMTYAAKNAKVFHLWWHPHNFGKDIDENILFLTKILKLVAKLNKEHGFKSLTMEEATTSALELNKENVCEKITPQSHYEL